MELVLIRHTPCGVPEGTCYGHLDVPLVQTYAADIAHTLAQTPLVSAVFSSPSRRCHELASALAARDGCTLRVLPELMELRFGEWEGRRWRDVPRDQSDSWAEDPWHRAPPGGESESDLWTRVQRAAAELQKTAAPRIAVVSHGGPLRLLRCLLTGTPIEQRWARSIECGGVVRIDCSSQLTVTPPRE